MSSPALRHTATILEYYKIVFILYLHSFTHTYSHTRMHIHSYKYTHSKICKYMRKLHQCCQTQISRPRTSVSRDEYGSSFTLPH